MYVAIESYLIHQGEHESIRDTSSFKVLNAFFCSISSIYSPFTGLIQYLFPKVAIFTPNLKMTPSALTQDYGLYIDDRESHKPEVDNACFAPETVQPEIIENEQRKVKPLQDFVQETNSEKVPPPKEATSPSSSAWNTRKTTILLLGAIVILIAIIAGVLGGFLGSRKSGGESQQVLTSLTK